MPLSPTKATADASSNQGHRGVALRVQSPGVFLRLRPKLSGSGPILPLDSVLLILKKRRLPEQPALSFLSFANAFLALFARGSSRTTSDTVRTCERIVGKARPPWSGNLSRSGRSPTPADACPRPRAHLTWEGYRRARTLTLACARRARCWCAASFPPCRCRSRLRGRPRGRTSPLRAAPRRARRSAESRHPRQASRRPEAP